MNRSETVPKAQGGTIHQTLFSHDYYFIWTSLGTRYITTWACVIKHRPDQLGNIYFIVRNTQCCTQYTVQGLPSRLHTYWAGTRSQTSHVILLTLTP